MSAVLVLKESMFDKPWYFCPESKWEFASRSNCCCSELAEKLKKGQQILKGNFDAEEESK